jgi:hypothetical protein
MIGPFNLGTLLICEGKEEMGLVRQMKIEGIIPPIEITCVGAPGNAPGIDALADHLVGLSGITGFPNIQKLGVFADNDLSSPDAFTRIQAAFVRANTQVSTDFPVPTAAYSPVSANGRTVSVALSPGPGLLGCLETNLLDVLAALHPDEMACVSGMISCAKATTNPPTWPGSKESKARIRAALTILHPRNPNVPLSALWADTPTLIPVSHPQLQYLSDFLNNL